MGKLAEMFKGLKEKWGQQSKVRKIVIPVLAVAILGSIIYIAVYLGSTKYAVLFKDMDATDAGAVTAKLKTEKVSYKVSGNSILVPANQVDSLRMDVLSNVTLTNGSKGWELLDNTSKFGVTDEQMQTTYQRALQGELERTIKSFPQISDARVIIVPSQDSAFVKDTTPATASVALKLKAGQELTKNQVKAIISLVSGSAKNLPKENVQVIDSGMRTLSDGIFSSEGTQTTDSDETDEVARRQKLKNDFEKAIETKITNQLNPVFKDGVRVTVNADLDFDANQTTSTIVSNGQVVSENNTKTTNGSGGQTMPTASPVDNNMTNSTSTTTTTTASNPSTTESSTKNYELSKSENKVIKAPGDVKRISASVVINGNIDDTTKTKVTNLVSSAINLDTTRGDVVSVEGLPFDTSTQTAMKKAIDDMNATEKANAQNKLYLEIGIGAAVLLLVIGAIVFTILKKRKKKDEDVFISDEMDNTSQIDRIVGDELVLDSGTEEKEKNEGKAEVTEDDDNEQKSLFKPIEFEADSEDAHVEREVRKYATEKPDQVADIIKSWLAKDER